MQGALVVLGIVSLVGHAIIPLIVLLMPHPK
jgi:hypothetical protein